MVTSDPGDPPWEPVWTMSDYYDGPRGGIASFRGVPHLYESRWNDLEQGGGSLFHLAPLEDDIFPLALEDWRIWLRWEAAFYAGLATMETHPALPADRARYEQLTRLLGDALQIGERPFVAVHGEFLPAERGIPAKSCLGAMKVRWTRLPSA
jgi:hypothetical protein